jgi:hypothetical protein
MAKIDRNRYRKVYGAKRVKPVFQEVGETTVVQVQSLETLSIDFSNSFSEQILCEKLYVNPVVIVTPTQNVNTFIKQVVQVGSVSAITVETSAPITGTVFIAVGEAA